LEPDGDKGSLENSLKKSRPRRRQPEEEQDEEKTA
jgi:hypothetical protein